MAHYDTPIHFRIPVYGTSGYLENLYGTDETTGGKSPVFILMDSEAPEELCMFIQSPDCYRECMDYATLHYYHRVNLFANQIDIRTISALFNLVKDLTARNIDTYVYYPEKFDRKMIPDDSVRHRFKKMTNWQSQVYPDISVEYRISNPTDKEAYDKGAIPKEKLYYDVVIKLPKQIIYLPALVTYDKVNTWCKDGRLVLIPYNTRFYDNSITYVDLESNHNWLKKYAKYVAIRSFPSYTAYAMAANSDPNFNPVGLFPRMNIRRFN